MDYNSIDAQTLKEYLHDGQEIALLDARDEVLHDKAHLFMASCVPLNRLEFLVPVLVPRQTTRVVWCDDGEGVAIKAAQKMHSLGYQDVSVLTGGVSAWRDAGFSVYNGVHVPSKAFAEVIEHELGTPWISVEELQQMIDTEQDFVLVDTRTVEEYVDNGLPGAISTPGAELVLCFPELVESADTTVVVHCGGRTRSIIGAQALIDAGYPNKVVSLRNGTQGWMLADFDVVRGSSQFAPEISTGGLEVAREAAKRMRDQFAIESVPDLSDLMANLDPSQSDPSGPSSKPEDRVTDRAARTTYLIDVRTRQEFEAGHLPNAKHVHGGQLIQETERHLAVWGALVVLVDDNGVRATITAAWLKQMGWDVQISTLGEWHQPLRTGAESGIVLKPPQEQATQWISPEELKRLIDADDVTVIDVDWSADYLEGHIPGAWWTLRARIAEDYPKVPTRAITVLTSSDGRLAELSVQDGSLPTGETLRVLSGGTIAWADQGFAMEQGGERLLGSADDIRLKARQESGDRRAAMRDYLNWELGLVEQLSKDDDPRYDVERYRSH